MTEMAVIKSISKCMLGADVLFVLIFFGHTVQLYRDSNITLTFSTVLAFSAEIFLALWWSTP